MNQTTGLDLYSYFNKQSGLDKKTRAVDIPILKVRILIGSNCTKASRFIWAASVLTKSDQTMLETKMSTPISMRKKAGWPSGQYSRSQSTNSNSVTLERTIKL